MKNTKVWFATLSLFTFGIVIFGKQLQDVLNLHPCPMCIFQRFLYIMISVIAFIGWIFPKPKSIWIMLIVGISILGLSVSGYQSWMQFYPETVTECGSGEMNIMEQFVEYLSIISENWFMPTGFCTSKEFEIFGLSLANLSFLLFSGIASVNYMFLKCKKV